MITRPTTDALIADCCRELIDAILPGLTDETLRLRLVMTETVLRNAAVRAAHEIAWMREETAALLTYARQVAARHGSEPLAAALAAAEAEAEAGAGAGSEAASEPGTADDGRLSRLADPPAAVAPPRARGRDSGGAVAGPRATAVAPPTTRGRDSGGAIAGPRDPANVRDAPLADSLHLADVTDRYERAGQAFAAALATAQEAGAADLVAQARELLRDRIATEKQIMATYAVVGR